MELIFKTLFKALLEARLWPLSGVTYRTDTRSGGRCQHLLFQRVCRFKEVNT